MRAPNVPRTLKDYLEHDRPQIHLYVISFTDATLVSFTFPHTLWDAMGMGEFLTAWTAVLAGRDHDVRPFHNYDTDPLKDLGRECKETHKLADRQLSILQLIVFGLRRWWDQMMFKEEGRIICIPKSYIQSLLETALGELKAGPSLRNDGGSEDELFLSDGDLLMSWIGRVVVKYTPLNPGQTVVLYNAFGMRPLLAEDVIPSTAAYVGNAVSAVYTLLRAGDISTRPFGFAATEARRSLTEQRTREQLEALTAMTRESIQKTGYPPLFGDGTMQLVIMTNWSKAKLFEMDFFPAVVSKADASPPAEGEETKKRGPVGRPSFIQPFGDSDYSVRYAFQVSGRDADGNYWLSAMLRKKSWAPLEEALKRGEMI